MPNNLVSIIIPTYNRVKFLGETLESVRIQDYPDWECLVIDDHSTDETASIVNEFAATEPRIKYFRRPTNLPKGANPCRNFGFEQSSGDFVNWFDSDDIMEPDFISAKVKAFARGDDAVISKRAVFTTDPTQIISYEDRTVLTENILEDFLTRRITFYLQDVMWRRDFLIGKRLFDQELLAGQDREFHVRMLLESPQLKVIDRYLTRYRNHPENITTNLQRAATLRISHLHGMAKLVSLLQESGKLSNEIRLHLFRAMMKYLPFVYDKPSDKQLLIELLQKLRFKSREMSSLWLRFRLALVSFRIFGKGYVFLK